MLLSLYKVLSTLFNSKGIWQKSSTGCWQCFTLYIYKINGQFCRTKFWNELSNYIYKYKYMLSIRYLIILSFIIHFSHHFINFLIPFNLATLSLSLSLSTYFFSNNTILIIYIYINIIIAIYYFTCKYRKEKYVLHDLLSLPML